MFAKNQTSKYGKLAELRTFKIIAKIWPELSRNLKISKSWPIFEMRSQFFACEPKIIPDPHPPLNHPEKHVCKTLFLRRKELNYISFKRLYTVVGFLLKVYCFVWIKSMFVHFIKYLLKKLQFKDAKNHQ